ncbi:MAG: dethiobiotin synthase [Verrucomicrobiae bacterium]|nr:dethiobiotin synthase [Verrucomicrobiae bacterium]
MKKLVVITGTDTGAGKTLLTALLLAHLRSEGHRTLAMKPFASGNTADADLFDRLQGGELPRPLLSPFFFRAPLAPMIAARLEHRKIRLADTTTKILQAHQHCDLLLVEGCGGLMAPLGDDFDLIDILKALQPGVIVCARNKLGVLNHVRLTHSALTHNGLALTAVVLMSVAKPDLSADTNAAVIRELNLAKMVLELPYLGRVGRRHDVIRTHARRLRGPLSGLAALLTSQSLP